MTSPDLTQLRDIHLPPSVSWWPPAPGWWIVGVILLVSALCAVVLIRRRIANRWRREALRELDTLRAARLAQRQRPQASLNGLSVLLRRVAISRFPRDEVASLHGGPWLAFLDRTFGQSGTFQPVGRLLSSGPYERNVAINAGDLDALFALAEKWIRKLPRGAQK
jgi:hypothetical protein